MKNISRVTMVFFILILCSGQAFSAGFIYDSKTEEIYIGGGPVAYSINSFLFRSGADFNYRDNYVYLPVLYKYNTDTAEMKLFIKAESSITSYSMNPTGTHFALCIQTVKKLVVPYYDPEIDPVKEYYKRSSCILTLYDREGNKVSEIDNIVSDGEDTKVMYSWSPDGNALVYVAGYNEDVGSFSSGCLTAENNRVRCNRTSSNGWTIGYNAGNTPGTVTISVYNDAYALLPLGMLSITIAPNEN